jgi:hypothetical protein
MGSAFFVAICSGVLSHTCGATATAEAVQKGRLQQQQHLSSKGLNPAALLLELIPEFQREAQTGMQLMASRNKFCSSIHSHREGIVAKLHEQIGVAQAEQQQLDAEEHRLIGEVEMSNSSGSQSVHQLEESKSLVRLASKTYLDERLQLNKSLQAVGTAVRLLRLRLDGKNPQESHKLSMHDLEALDGLPVDSTVSHTILDEAEGNSDASEELMQDLVALDNQLRLDAADADYDQAIVSEKLRAAKERVTSSILQAQSQAAMAKMDLAERHRRHARVKSDLLSTSTLLEAAQASDAAVKSDCSTVEKKYKEIAQLIVKEVGAIKETLGKLPASQSQWITGNPIDTGTGNLRGSAPAFIQISQQPASPQHDVVEAVATEEADDAEKSPLDNIQQFAASSSKVDSNAHAVKVVGQEAVAANLKQDMASKAASARKSWCSAISKSTSVDEAALRYASDQVVAKLHLAQSEVADCKERSKFDLEQSEILKHQSRQSRDLRAQEEQARKSFIVSLRKRSQQLSGLLAELDQKSEPAEQKMAKQITDILRNIQRHQTLLQRQQTGSSRQAEQANEKVRKMFARRAQSTKSRQMQRESEVQALGRLVRARTGAFSSSNEASAAALSKLCEDETTDKNGDFHKLEQKDHALLDQIARA